MTDDESARKGGKDFMRGVKDGELNSPAPEDASAEYWMGRTLGMGFRGVVRSRKVSRKGEDDV